MKIRKEHYPLLSGQANMNWKIDQRLFSDFGNYVPRSSECEPRLKECREIIKNVHNNGETLFFTKPVMDCVKQNWDKLNEGWVNPDLKVENRSFCILLPEGHQVFIEFDAFANVRYLVAKHEWLISFNGAEGRNTFDFAAMCVMFYLYAEREVVLLDKVNRKAKLYGTKWYNETDCQVKIIDSKHYRDYVQTGHFKVRSHLAWRNFGEGRNKRRLVWIEEYTKRGYTRAAGILQEQ